jgi:hypothetical protein
VQAGCIVKPLAWWLEYIERCAAENGCSEIQQREARMHLLHVKAWMELYGMDREPVERAAGKDGE